MKAAVACLFLALGISAPVRADIQPAELVASSITLRDSFVIGHIYCGGTYGQVYPGGRTARLEYRVAGGAWNTLWSGRLPDIGPGGYYIARPFGVPLKQTTTFRLSISPGDRNASNDAVTRTFAGPVDLRLRDRIYIAPRFDPKMEDSKLKAKIVK